MTTSRRNHRRFNRFPSRMQPRRLERLEGRVLFASVSIDTPDSPITRITFQDTGEFQFKSTQVFEQNAGDGQVYQFTGGLPLSGVFLRTDDGTVYGNSSVVSGSIPFVATSQQARTTNGGDEVIVSTFAPSNGAPFQITQEVTYTPGSVFFFVNNTVQNTGSAQLVFSFFAYADPNPRGRGIYDAGLGAIASIDADGQPTVVIDPLDGTSTTAAEFHEAGSFFEVTSKIAAPGGTLGFTPDAPQPPATFEQDTGIALQWANDFIDPGTSALYAFTVGNDPVGGDTTPPPNDDDSERPTARLGFINNTGPTTRTVVVNYDDGFDATTRSGVNADTFDDNDVFLTGPGIDDTNRFPSGVNVITSDPTNNFFAVEYTFTAPAGFGNGVYDISLFPGGVSDAAGNAAIAGSDSGADPNKLGFFEVGPARLTVTREAGADALRQKLLGDNTGLTITNFAVRGQQGGDSGDVSTGTYVNPGGLYGLSPSGGIVISTGDAGDYSSGPNLDFSGNSYDTTADAGQETLLDQLSPAGSNDITYRDVTQIDITFDLASGVNNIFFDVVWGTEETPGSSTLFPDGFGLFLNGVNIARTPTLSTNDGNATEPINVANSNLARIEGTELDAVVAVGGNPVISFSALDGPNGPVPLRATGNTLTFIIADAEDSLVASTAFISALGVRQTATVDTSNIATSIDVLAVGQQAGRVVIAGATQDGAPVCQGFVNGVLDAAFGTGGTAQSFGFGSGSIQALLVQPDGKIVVAGSAGAGGDVFVGRYNVNGTTDSGFGGGDGVVTLDVGSQRDIAFGLELDALGRIIVAGSTDTFVNGKAGSDFVVARFTADGVLDASFSGGDATPGFSVDEFDPGDVNRAGSIAVTANNGVVVAGQTGSLVAVAKYNENGSLDTGFDADGKRILNELKTTDPVVGLAVQGDGKILVAASDAAGAEGQLIGSNFLLARLTTAGALDTGFGAGGIVRTDMGGTEDADAIRLGAAGIYVFGTRATDKAGDPNNVIVNTAVALYNDAGGNTTMLGPNGYVFFDPVTFKVAETGSPNNPQAIGNPFADLLRSVGAVDSNGGVVASKPNVSGAGSNVVQVVQAANNPETPAPPTAALPAGLQITTGQPDFSFTVEYTDTNGVSVAGVGTDDISVRRGDVALVVKSAVVNNNTNGTPRSVTYNVGPADGSFDRFDNGTYVVRLAANQITDVNGLAAAEADIGSFTVAVPAPTGTPFGGRTKATVTDPASGAPVTLQLSSGTAQVFVENGRINLQLDNVSNATLNIKARGAVTLGNVVVNGSLKSLSGKTANLSGTLQATSFLGKITLANVSGGTVAAAGGIGGLTLASATNAKFLAGTNLGTDMALGGGDDAFANSSSIGKVTIKGAISGGTIFAASVNPGSGNTYGDGNDTGGGGVLFGLSAKGGADPATRFLAAVFPKSARLGAKVTPATDARFIVI